MLSSRIITLKRKMIFYFANLIYILHKSYILNLNYDIVEKLFQMFKNYLKRSLITKAMLLHTIYSQINSLQSYFSVKGSLFCK